ncbi:hypothetical protein B9Z55_001918 [Caenorhabditis nigoni]|uniref:Uncharacterized protein n=1 Tax=Caenorhabditis nigoni TaxID=1611254 RepID=A0A2G5VI27_9PELO|nr:hypothetical protein B9Z55_001918 [Caenorhabditis nigoni]
MRNEEVNRITTDIFREHVRPNSPPERPNVPGHKLQQYTKMQQFVGERRQGRVECDGCTTEMCPDGRNDDDRWYRRGDADSVEDEENIEK